MTITTTTIPRPAGATEIGEWRLAGGTARSFTGTKRVTAVNWGDDVRVDIAGYQDRDGPITERTINLNGNHFLVAAEARALGADLLAAADELDALGR